MRLYIVMDDPIQYKFTGNRKLKCPFIVQKRIWTGHYNIVTDHINICNICTCQSARHRHITENIFEFLSYCERLLAVKLLYIFQIFCENFLSFFLFSLSQQIIQIFCKILLFQILKISTVFAYLALVAQKRNFPIHLIKLLIPFFHTKNMFFSFRIQPFFLQPSFPIFFHNVSANCEGTASFIGIFTENNLFHLFSFLSTITRNELENS